MTDKKKTSAQRLMALFAGRSDAHGTHGIPRQRGLKWEIKTTARTVRDPVTEALWAEHLAGTAPLGVIAIREDSTCCWGSIDIDLYDRDLLGIVSQVEAARYPLVPCRSKSGGLHLFLFLTEPVPAGAVRDLLRAIAARLGLAQCEIFPVQSEVLSDRGDLGNWMVMPYFGGNFGGKLRDQVGVKHTGAEQTLDEFLAFAERMRVTPATLATLASTGGSPPGQAPPKRGRGSKPAEEAFKDGPVCLQHLSGGGALADGRKRALFMMGLYYKRSDPANWQARVEAANQLFFAPALPSEEVTGVVRSLAKKEYEYTCKVQPMEGHCNAGLCRTRRFGVGGKGQFPVITGLSKLDTDPPVWFLDVDDQRFEATTEQLLNYPLMQRLFAAKGNKVFRTMRQSDWVDALVEPMENAVIMEAPPDAGASGRFHEILEDFLVNRWRGQSREDLLRGKPWEETDPASIHYGQGGRHYFRLRDVQLLLAREAGMRDLTRGQIVRHIQRLGGAHYQFNVKSHNVTCWWVPADVVQTTPELDVPEGKRSVI